MQVITRIDELPSDFSAGAVAIGNFDGVHRGHAHIVRQLIRRAEEFSGPAVVFTFEPHPVRLLRPEAAPAPLTWVDRKAELLAELDVDLLIAYPTTRDFLSLTADEYFQRVVCRQLRTRAIVEGPNFFFGRNREGNVDLLRQLCDRHSITLDIVQPIKLGAEYISSSRVRTAIAAGDVDSANAMLTQPYRIRGMVTHGVGRGTSIGYPTANISAIDTLLPGSGVYAGLAHVGGETRKAAINVGPNPTFDEQGLKVEVHLIDFSGSIYGEPLEIDFVRRLRDIQKFATPDELRQQLALDVTRASQVPASYQLRARE